MRYDRSREDEFRAELRELFYRYYGARLAEIEPVQVIREAFQLIYSLNLRLRRSSCWTRRSRRSARSGSSSIPPSTSSRWRSRTRAASCSERFTPQRGARAVAQGGLEARADRLRPPVPGARPDGGGARRPDRGRIRAQGHGRVHAQGWTSRSTASSSRSLVVGGLIGSSAHRDVRDRRPAVPRRECALVHRLRAFRHPGRLAALGGYAPRTALERPTRCRHRGTLPPEWTSWQSASMDELPSEA